MAALNFIKPIVEETSGISFQGMLEQYMFWVTLLRCSSGKMCLSKVSLLSNHLKSPHKHLFQLRKDVKAGQTGKVSADLPGQR